MKAATKELAKIDTIDRTVYADEMARSGPISWLLSASNFRAHTVENAFF